MVRDAYIRYRAPGDAPRQRLDRAPRIQPRRLARLLTPQRAITADPWAQPLVGLSRTLSP